MGSAGESGTELLASGSLLLVFVFVSKAGLPHGPVGARVLAQAKRLAVAVRLHVAIFTPLRATDIVVEAALAIPVTLSAHLKAAALVEGTAVLATANTGAKASARASGTTEATPLSDATTMVAQTTTSGPAFDVFFFLFLSRGRSCEGHCQDSHEQDEGQNATHVGTKRRTQTQMKLEATRRQRAEVLATGGGKNVAFIIVSLGDIKRAREFPPSSR